MAIRTGRRNSISSASTVAYSNLPAGLAITSIIVTDSSYNTIDDTAIGTSNGYIRILGVGFTSGFRLYLSGTDITAYSTFMNPGEIRVAFPATSVGSYSLMLFNSASVGAIYSNFIISGFPSFSSSSYSSQETVSVQLLATGDSTLTYSLQAGSTLPGTVTLSSTGLLSGTVSSEGVYSFTVLVNDSQNQTTQQTITLTVAFSEPYFKYVQTLLDGETSSSNIFIKDASVINTALNINGDTRADRFNPYTDGYYSTLFTGSDYIAGPSNNIFAVGTGDITVECWLYQTSIASYPSIFQIGAINQTGSLAIFIDQTSSNRITVRCGGSGQDTAFGASGTATIPLNVWTHLAVVRSSGNWTAYINGVKQTFFNNVSNSITLNTPYFGGGSGTGTFLGHISNLRVSNTALYSATFTPPTTAYTTTNNTLLLTCQSNRLIDTSFNTHTLTLNGTPKVTPAHPFATPTTAAYNTQYSTYLDGTTDYVSLTSTSSHVAAGDATVECWFYPYAETATRAWIFSQGTNATAAWGVAMNASTRYLAVWADGFVSAKFTTTTAVTLNQWHHLALVKSSGVITVYLDGVLQAGSYSQAGSFGQSGSNMVVGAYSASIGNNALNGLVSNFRYVVGTALYSGSTITPPTAPLTPISGTQVLTCQDSTIKDNSNSSPSFTITGAGQAQPIAVSPFTMTTANTTVTSLGSSYFDGSGDYIDSNLTNTFTFGTGDFTVEYWVYYARPINNNFQCHIGDSSTSTNIGFGTGAAGIVYASTSTTGYSGSASIVPFSWQHIAWSRSSGTLRGFLNGVQVYSGSVGTSFTSTGFAIGSGKGGTFIFEGGQLSDVRVINGTALYTQNFLPPQAPLTPVTNTQLLTAQYKGQAKNNGFVDNSKFNTNVVTYGNTTQGTFSPYSQTGWSYYFDGHTGAETEYVDTAYPASSLLTFGTGAFTIEAWIYPQVYYQPTASGPPDRSMIWSCGYAEGGTPRPMFSLNSSGKLACGGWNGANNVVGGTTVPLNTWTHAMVTFDGTTYRIFYNGILDGSSTNIQNYSGTTHRAAIGANPDPSYRFPFKGFISNVRVLKGTALYTASFSVPTAPLTAITNTVFLSAQSNRFIDNSPFYHVLTKGTTSRVTVQAFSPFAAIKEAAPLSYSAAFDGSGYIVIPGPTNSNASPAFGLSTSNYTVEGWWLFNDGENDTGLWDFRTTTDGSGGIKPNLIFSSNQLRLSIGSTTKITASFTPSIGTWYHIAVCRIAGVTTIYVNGVSVGTYNGSEDFSTTSTLSVSTVGDSLGYSTLELNGAMSNFRVVKGIGIYTGTFTPPTSPLGLSQNAGTNISAVTSANVTYLGFNSNAIVDVSTYGSNHWILANATPIVANPFGFTAASPANYTTALNGGSAYFDGTGDYLGMPVKPEFAIGTRDFTAEAWVYPTTLNQAWSTILGQTSFGSSSNWSLYVGDGTNQLRPSFIFINGGSQFAGTYVNNILSNCWNHVAVTRTGTAAKLFINGQLAAKRYSNDTLVSSAGLNPTIGAALAGNGSTTTTGYITDVRINMGSKYDSSFIPSSNPLQSDANTTLLLNFTDAAVADKHGSVIFETRAGTQLTGNVSQGGSYSVSFAGSGFLYAPPSAFNNFNTADFTFEAWINLNAAASGTYYLAAIGSEATNRYVIYLVNGVLTTNYYGVGAVSMGGSIASNTWTHVAVCRSNATIRGFINGSLLGTTETNSANIGNYGPIRIGSDASGTTNFSGAMDNIRLTRGFARYTGAFSAPTGTLPGR